MAGARKAYEPVLFFSLKRPFIIIAGAIVLMVVTSVQLSRLGSEFLPKLDEGDIAMHAMRITGTGLEQSIEMQKKLEVVISELDEVERVFSKVGTPEVATDPMPPSVADTILIIKPPQADAIRCSGSNVKISHRFDDWQCSYAIFFIRLWRVAHNILFKFDRYGCRGGTITTTCKG